MTNFLLAAKAFFFRLLCINTAFHCQHFVRRKLNKIIITLIKVSLVINGVNKTAFWALRGRLMATKTGRALFNRICLFTLVTTS